MSEAECCPACGQRVLVRYKVKLSPRTADIWDAIERAGDMGIEVQELGNMFYSQKSERKARALMSRQVVRINEWMDTAKAGVRVCNQRGLPYRVIRR